MSKYAYEAGRSVPLTPEIVEMLKNSDHTIDLDEHRAEPTLGEMDAIIAAVPYDPADDAKWIQVGLDGPYPDLEATAEFRAEFARRRVLERACADAAFAAVAHIEHPTLRARAFDEAWFAKLKALSDNAFQAGGVDTTADVLASINRRLQLSHPIAASKKEDEK